MTTNRTLKGIVVDKFTGKRFPNTTVRIAAIVDEGRLPSPIAHAITDADGHFSIPLEDSQVWKPGNYAVAAFHPDVRQDPSLSISLDEKQGLVPNPIELEIVPNEELSQSIGSLFLLFLIVCLGALVYSYFELHKDNREVSVAPSAPVVALLELGERQLVALAKRQSETPAISTLRGAGTVTIATGDELAQPAAVSDSGLVSARTVLDDTLAAIEALLDESPSETTHGFSPDKVSALKLLLERLKKAVSEGNGSAAQLAFAVLRGVAYETKVEYFWTENPQRQLEVLFWALAATLIRLILNTGYYLRLQCFHRHAIGHHISLITTIPILAVLIAFVISLVKISIALGDVAISLDMTNVTISIVVAALIGLAPWGARDFLGDLADALFRKLRGLLKPSPASQ